MRSLIETTTVNRTWSTFQLDKFSKCYSRCFAVAPIFRSECESPVIPGKRFFRVVFLLNQLQFHIFNPRIPQTPMKSSYLFLGIFVTCLMMSLTANAEKSYSPHYQKYKCETEKALSVRASSETLPVNESGDDIPKIDVTPSNNSLTSSFCIRSTQELFCLFEILFEKEKNEQYQPRIPVTLNNFFLHLFRIIISPNAP